MISSTGIPADWKVNSSTTITKKAERMEIIKLSVIKAADRSRELVELPTT